MRVWKKKLCNMLSKMTRHWSLGLVNFWGTKRFTKCLIRQSVTMITSFLFTQSWRGKWPTWEECWRPTSLKSWQCWRSSQKRWPTSTSSKVTLQKSWLKLQSQWLSWRSYQQVRNIMARKEQQPLLPEMIVHLYGCPLKQGWNFFQLCILFR